VDDLNKQKESVAAHLAQISQLLGNQMTGLGAAMQPAQAAPAVSASPAKAVTAAPANGGSQAAPAPAPSPRQNGPSGQAPGGQAPGGQAPGGQGAGGRSGGAPSAKQSVSAKSAKSGDNEDWWTD
jgi:hypothetical protein